MGFVFNVEFIERDSETRKRRRPLRDWEKRKKKTQKSSNNNISHRIFFFQFRIAIKTVDHDFSKMNQDSGQTKPDAKFN